MTKKFTTFSTKDFETFLGVGNDGKPVANSNAWKFHKIEIQGTYENVYGMRVAPNITLRIYSTLEGGFARDNGKDAIRCVLFWKSPEDEIKLIGVEKKVLRIETWRDNLGKRINEWKDMMGPSCPLCKSPMTKRKNRTNKNEFYGCVQYPTCKSTIPIGDKK